MISETDDDADRIKSTKIRLGLGLELGLGGHYSPHQKPLTLSLTLIRNEIIIEFLEQIVCHDSYLNLAEQLNVEDVVRHVMDCVPTFHGEVGWMLKKEEREGEGEELAVSPAEGAEDSTVATSSIVETDNNNNAITSETARDLNPEDPEEVKPFLYI
jgi:hypothetical protein